jgi:hypothetical protein
MPSKEREQPTAQDHQVARLLPERRCGDQADLAGGAQHHGRLESGGPQLEGGDESVRDTRRRAIHAAQPQTGLNHGYMAQPGRLRRPGRGVKSR